MLFYEFVIISLVIFSFVTTLFVLSVIIKRNDVADVAWGMGIFLVALTSYFLSIERDLLTDILLFLVALWGVRLSVRIFLRNIKKDEDYRYKKWRTEWGRWFYVRSYFQVYLLQGFLMIIIGYPVIHASIYSNNESIGAITFLGILMWGIGYFFEVVGDFQLDRFINNKPRQGSILSTGLWQYTRHPNYFGEVTMWWGLWLMVTTLPYGYIAILSPLTITFLILKVSGIPMLEKKYEGNQDFEEYKQKTSAFFPRKPRS